MVAIPFMSLDLTPGNGNLLGESYWEILSPSLGGSWTLNTGVSPRDERVSSLSQILEGSPPRKYYLSRKACLGILRRARERGKPLPSELEAALKSQAGLMVSLRPLHGPLPLAFHMNQRDEAIDLGETAGALMATSNMQMQTFVTAGFCAGAGPSAGSIGYQEEVAPTLKATASGNMMPSVLCLNDQGGKAMECSEYVSGTLRAQEHGHQPLVYEDHGIDARYTGPHEVVPTLSARAGTGGNNLPLVEVFNRQRCDRFEAGHTASTQSARQHKEATDLVYQQTVGALTTSDSKGPNAQYVSQDKLVVEGPLLIRRLTPRECERLQGFPDDWTDLPGAADAPRYKALGNSVAIPCVEYLMHGMALALRAGYRAACKKAVDINDLKKVSFLLEQAADHVPDLPPFFHGELAVYAYLDHRFIAKEIVIQCSDEQIAAAPPHLLEQFAMDGDYRTMSMLVEKGISGGPDASRTLHMLTYEGRNSWMAEDLLQKRMWVDATDYGALNACVENDAVDVAKLLLDGGMDFEQYRLRYPNSGSEETIRALDGHWSGLQDQAQEQADTPQMGGMTFG